MASQVDIDPVVEPPGAKGPQLTERAGLAVFWNAVFLPLKLVVKLAASVIFFRFLSDDGVALYASITAGITLLGLLSDFGIERALPRFMPEVEQRGGQPELLQFLRRITLLRALNLAPFLVLLALFPSFFADIMNLGAVELPEGLTIESILPVMLTIIAAMLILGAASDISYQVLYAYFRQRVTNLIDILNSLLIPGLRSVLVLVLGVLGAIYGLLIGTVVSVIVSVGLMFRALRQELPERSKKDKSSRQLDPRTFWRRFIALAGLMQVISVSAALYDVHFLIFMTGLVISSDEQRVQTIGLAALCFNFVRQMLSNFVAPMSGVQTPLFSRLYAENRIEGLRTAYASFTKFLILVLVPAGVGIIIMSRNVLMLAVGQVREEQVLTRNTLPEVVIACSILVIGLFGEAIISVAMNVLVVYEQHRAVLVARSVALISIPLFVLLLPQFGVVGGALAVAITALASRFTALIYALRTLELEFPLRFLTRVSAATAGFAVLIGPLAYMLPAQPTIIDPLASILLVGANGILILAAIAIFFVVFRLLGGIDAEDKARFSGMRIPGIKFALRFL